MTMACEHQILVPWKIGQLRPGGADGSKDDRGLACSVVSLHFRAERGGPRAAEQARVLLASSGRLWL